MNTFIAKPLETITGIGFDFSNRLATGEIITHVDVTPDTGITVNGTNYSNTIAVTDITIGANTDTKTLNLVFSITGSAGSIRKATRLILVRSKSDKY